MAATGKGTHVVERPGHAVARLDESADPRRGHEACHPVNIHQVGSGHGGMRGQIPSRPVGREQGVGDRRAAVPDRPANASIEPPSRGSRWAAVVPHDDIDRGAARPQSGRKPLHGDRSTARVAELMDQVSADHIEGGTGIAHTRWATHGAPAVHNAHPHFSHGTGAADGKPGKAEALLKLDKW